MPFLKLNREKRPYINPKGSVKNEIKKYRDEKQEYPNLTDSPLVTLIELVF